MNRTSDSHLTQTCLGYGHRAILQNGGPGFIPHGMAWGKCEILHGDSVESPWKISHVFMKFHGV